MIYRRSQTDMDAVSQFTPQSLLRGLHGLGQWETEYGGEGNDFILPPTYDTVSPPLTQDPGWDWQGFLRQAPAMLRDLYVAAQTGDYQAKLMEINLERAKRGQAPLDMQRYGPQVQVGVAPQTMTFAGLGIGTLAAIGIGAYILLAPSQRAARRRRSRAH